MDAGVAALLGAIAGAVLAGGANLIIEYWKHQSERRGIASAIAGEISAVLYGIETRQLVEYFEWLAVNLRSSEPITTPWFFYNTKVDSTPVIKAYIGRIGTLEGDLPRRVAHFYTLYESVLTELQILVQETEPSAGAIRIERTLPIWYRTKTEGKTLISDLMALGGMQPE